MFKFLLLTLVLVSSSTSGLLESLFRTEESCYSRCQSNNAMDTSAADACKKGCDYKLHGENCVDQCSLVSQEKQLRASCLLGCSAMESVNPSEIDNARPHSIILIRLRQRPTFAFPPWNNLFKKNPTEMFQDLVKDFNIDTAKISQSTDMDRTSQLKTILELARRIPTMRLPDGVRLDSSNGEGVNHAILFQEEIHQSVGSRFQQWVGGVRRQWNDLVSQQPNLPIWIVLGLFLSLSAAFWYMIVSLCSDAPAHHTFTVRARELLFDKTQNKEDIQSESYPIKVKLADM